MCFHLGVPLFYENVCKSLSVKGVRNLCESPSDSTIHKAVFLMLYDLDTVAASTYVGMKGDKRCERKRSTKVSTDLYSC